MPKAKIFIALILFCGVLTPLFAQTTQSFPFLGEVSAGDINLRVDSTVSADVICQVQKGDRLEVVAEFYEWYKVRLPQFAPAYIHKALVELMDAQTAKVTKDRVNIRLMPSESSPIIGMVDKAEAVNILEFRRDWYKIRPVQNSFGWINKKFVQKILRPVVPVPAQSQPEEKITPPGQEPIVLEGALRSYGRVFRRQATHKLIAKDKKVYLLKGNTAVLNSLTRLKVKVTGRVVSPPKAKHPLIEVDKIEVLN